MRETIIIGIVVGVLFFAAGVVMTALAIKYATTAILWDVLLWSGVGVMIASVATLALYIWSQTSGGAFWVPAALLNLGVSAVITGIAYSYTSIPAGAAAEYLYFYADMADDTNPGNLIPLAIRNTSSGPYMNVIAWFSPASAKGNPDLQDYWSLGPLRYINAVQQAGNYRAGRALPLGYYRIEITCNKGEKTANFVELIELREFGGKVVPLVDVWGDGIKLYTSPRPAELQDNRTP
jgi:hypothetical protein